MIRTSAEIKAYIDGYNDCFNQFIKCLNGGTSKIRAIHKMEVFKEAVDNCIIVKEQEHERSRDI